VCCYTSVRMGQFQGQASYRLTRICHEHCPLADCECLNWEEHLEVCRYEVDLWTIPLDYPFNTAWNGYPKLQAYWFDWGLGLGTIQGWKEVLRTVSSSTGDSSIVLPVPAEVRSSSWAGWSDKRG
jgi:hypothetical protein